MAEEKKKKPFWKALLQGGGARKNKDYKEAGEKGPKDDKSLDKSKMKKFKFGRK